jgi:hypothetical protein
MLKRLLNDRKGVAEVIGTVFFIIILLFFFSNVYLWHDAATKEMNDLYVEKINSPITLTFSGSNPTLLSVTNNGGVDATLSALWVITGSGPTQNHIRYTNGIQNIIVPPGETIDIPSYYSSGETIFKVITTVGNSAADTS